MTYRWVGSHFCKCRPFGSVRRRPKLGPPLPPAPLPTAAPASSEAPGSAAERRGVAGGHHHRRCGRMVRWVPEGSGALRREGSGGWVLERRCKRSSVSGWISRKAGEGCGCW